MKHLIPLLLAALLLSGCVARPASSPVSSSTAPLSPSTTLGGTQSSFAPTTSTAPSTAPSAPAGSICSGHDGDPYENVNVEEFYANYTTACCNDDARYRSEHYLMSGALEVPGQYVTTLENQPMEGTAYIRNTDSFYLEDGETYIVVDSNGQEVLRIYRGGAYITLEEVAAYMYAFGNDSIPANYESNKKAKPTKSPWGIYLRVNHSKFTGDTSKYPYEPEMPNITGCGGQLQYYEMDIGTTGSGNSTRPYNNGTTITRGAARIIYARQDLNGDGVYSEDEVYLFYTANHYNDFQEYLNYYGGWGQIFGNVTGGGVHDSKIDCNPTPYPETAYASFSQMTK